MKRADLEKSKGKKIAIQMDQSAIPDRFGSQAAAPLDRREQRKRDQALGLVPFAIKLDGELVKQIQALAAERRTDTGTVVAELLKKGMQAGHKK